MSPSSETPPRLVVWLRAAGEITRLRLIALCAQRDLSVSDLAMAIGQSEPRVSRHLKILSEAGLIARLRQGQWVHYQVSRAGAAAGFVQGLLAQLDRADATFARDSERLNTKVKSTSATPAGGSRLGRALQDSMSAARGETAAASALVSGVDHPELLASTAELARQCTALASSRRAAQQARAFAEREGLSCRVLLAAQREVSERELARAGAPFDLIVLDRIAAGEAGTLKTALVAVRAALAPQGRLWLFENYEALEGSHERVVEHPLSRLRRLLTEAGFACDRLSPVEADGAHVLAAAAVAVEKSNKRVA